MKIDKPVLNQLKNLEKKLLTFQTRDSSDYLSEILSEEFIEFGSSGKTYNKKEIIKSLQNENTPRMSLTSFKRIQLCKEYYLVTYKAVKEDENEKIYSNRSSIWKKEKEKYQIIFHQGTLIQE